MDAPLNFGFDTLAVRSGTARSGGYQRRSDPDCGGT